MPPGEPLFAFTETGKVAAAGRAPVRSGTQAQQNARPAGRVIVLLAPGGEFLAIAARTARIFPCAVLPNTGLPARAATPAPQWILADQSAKLLSKPVAVRHSYIAGAALRASKLHSPEPRSIIADASNGGYGFAPSGSICLHTGREGPLQPVAGCMTGADAEALDRRHG